MDWQMRGQGPCCFEHCMHAFVCCICGMSQMGAGADCTTPCLCTGWPCRCLHSSLGYPNGLPVRVLPVRLVACAQAAYSTACAGCVFSCCLCLVWPYVVGWKPRWTRGVHRNGVCGCSAATVVDCSEGKSGSGRLLLAEFSRLHVRVRLLQLLHVVGTEAKIGLRLGVPSTQWRFYRLTRPAGG